MSNEKQTGNWKFEIEFQDNIYKVKINNERHRLIFTTLDIAIDYCKQQLKQDL